MSEKSFADLYWETEKSISAWVAEHLPGQGAFLPMKLAAGGMAAAADNGANKTLAEKVSDYGAGVIETAASVPQTSITPEIQQTVAETVTNAETAIKEGLSSILTVPTWAKYALAAVVILTTYEMMKGKRA